ncbi:MAG: hypothetical protein J6A79_16105 [Clostridia bacterium]|nr:hypothetical protein [Clostridia bacterium]
MQPEMPQDDIQKNIRKIAVVSAVLLVVLWIVYAVIGRFSAAVLAGGLIGWAAANFNLVLLGQAVRRAMDMGDQTMASASLRSSYAGRMLMQVGAVALSYFLPWADSLACIIALVLPHAAIMLIQLAEKRGK